MKIRPKTVRRLLALAAGAVVLCGTVGIVFTARRHARDAQIAQARQAGLEAYQSHQYSKALECLNRYVLSRPTDVEALYALGSARMALETPYRDYLYEARLRFQQLLVIEPEHQAAALKLLEVYDKTNQNSEMLELANSVLARTPNQPTAMRFAAVALTRLNRPAEARKAWQALVAVTPGDVNAQSQLLVAMRADGEESEKIIEYAQKLVVDHTSEPHFQIPLAVALRDAGREAESLAVLKKLTASPLTEPEAVSELVTLLDRAGAFADAERVLDQAAHSLDSSSLNTALVQRVWQGGNSQAVIVLTDKLIADGRAQPTALALRALSLAALDQRDAAEAVVRQLAQGESAVERAWTVALEVEFSGKTTTAAQHVAALTTALGLDPNNGILYTWLARAMVQIGEIDQAARCYREAAQRMPSWTTPCLELAQTMLKAGRNDEAIPAAKAAFLRSPKSITVAIQLARVRYASLLRQFDDSEQTQLLKFVTSLRESTPDEPTLLPIHIALLARSGDAAGAQALIGSSLAKKPSAQALAELFAIDQQYSLGRSDAILKCASDSNQLSSELTVSVAAKLASQGKTAEARALVQALASRAETTPDAALAVARVRTLLGDTDAGAAWQQAASRFPDNLPVQMAVLRDGVQAIPDRLFRSETIQRVRKLTGDNALYWRIEQAKFLSESESPDDWRQALTLATELLRQQPTRTDLRVLLGRVLTRLDSKPAALEHLRAAYDQSPGDAVIGLELVDAFVQLSRVNDASAVLKRLSTVDIEDPALRNRVAAALIDNGMRRELLGMLQRAEGRHFLDASGRMLLAESLAADGQQDAASKSYRELLANDPSPAALASAAAFERESGRPQVAEELLGRIANAPGSVATRQHALARYYAKFGDIEPARKAFRVALDDSSSTLAMCRDAIAMECAAGNLAQAQELLDVGQKRFGNQPLLRRAKMEIAAIGSSNSPVALEGVLRELSDDPDAKSEADALRAVLKAREEGNITAELAIALSQLANRYPAAIDLQKQAINACVSTSQSGPAIAMAHRLATLGPGRADLQALAAQTLAQFGQWNSARRIAERWRALEPSKPRDADLLLSAIAQAAGDCDQSLKLSEPYAKDLDPAKDLTAIAARAAALLETNRSAACFELLKPWISSSAAIRSVWIDAVMRAPVDEAPSQLEQLARVLPADAEPERVRVAAACLEVGEDCESGSVSTLGLSLVTPFAAAENASEDTRVLRAELLRVCNEPDLAEKELRAALGRFPQSVRARNSLAYLLISQNKSLDEALELAGQAATMLPNQPNVLDTHARALMATGDYANASRVFTEALRHDPNSFDAIIGLATLRKKQGSDGDVQALVSRVDELLKRTTRRAVPAHLRGEFGSLRQSLTGSRD